MSPPDDDAAKHHKATALISIMLWLVQACNALDSMFVQITRGVSAGIFRADYAAEFQVTFALAYALVASYLLQFFIFWLCKAAFIDEPVTTVVVQSSKHAIPWQVQVKFGLSPLNRACCSGCMCACRRIYRK